ncbi:MAG TPA: sigma-54 dependent transcriptional regulator [Steroidobacteraceae bacterium]|jgi:two-component system response regulator HydG|nr:sigma-54 dependent transcriptional regulator [Steroidobacteraceae bacterium]
MNSVSYGYPEHPAPPLSAPPLPATESLLGSSAAMQEVFRLIERVGPTEASVLLTGESGSGKELAARMIHEHSARRSHPFIAINCGAIPAGLIEAELFGYEKGSFTGAVRAHAGVFERAHGGTLLLDEVTEMPLEMQTRLLRVLESRKFYRVGASTEYTCDVRVIAATNRCPLTAAQAGQLREDLLYRLAVFPIDMPPLRSRGDDVELLAGHFLSELNAQAMTQKRLSAQARMTLQQHSWPGNVRELKNCIERAFILSDSILELAPLLHNGVRGVDHAAGVDENHGYSADRERLDIRVGSRIYDMERSLIEATLDYFKGNKRRAADALGCSLKTLYNKLNGYSQSQECANS